MRRQPLEVESAALGAALQAAAAASGQDVAKYISDNPPAMSQEVRTIRRCLSAPHGTVLTVVFCDCLMAHMVT